MPRRPTEVSKNVPLFTVPHIIMQRIRQHGGEVEWVEAKRVNHHHYTVRVRTKPVKREFRNVRPAREHRVHAGEGP